MSDGQGPVAAFDIFDFDDAVHKAFRIEPTDPIDSNFEAIGFDSKYILVNMGSLFIFYVFYATMFCCVTPISRCCKRRCNRCHQCSTRLKRYTYWSALITLLNESLIILAVCVLINI